MSNLQSDIDYMKSLAEAGGKGPLRNGATLFWAGLLYGLASIGQYALIIGWLPKWPGIAIAMWFGASLLLGLLSLVSGGARSRAGCSPVNRASGSAWTAVVIGIFACMACLVIIANIYKAFEPMSYLMAPIVLLLYGIGWWVSAQMSGQAWLKLISLGSFLAAPAISCLAGRPVQILAYAACLFLFAMVPGLVLMRAEKA